MVEPVFHLRSDHRIPVPEGYVREIALWFCEQKDYLRLRLEDLGRPDLRLTKLGSGRMVLFDVTVRGMGLSLEPAPESVQGILSAQAMHAYLQLWDPTTDDPNGVLSVFAHCRLAKVEPIADRLTLGVRFMRFAIASTHDKSLDFLDATRCGINDLARWCDNIDRGVIFEAELAGGGLDMDNLLAEVENVLTPGAPESNAAPHSPEAS